MLVAKSWTSRTEITSGWGFGKGVMEEVVIKEISDRLVKFRMK